MLTLLQGQVGTGLDPELRAAVARSDVPVVRQHLKMLRQLQASVVASR